MKDASAPPRNGPSYSMGKTQALLLLRQQRIHAVDLSVGSGADNLPRAIDNLPFELRGDGDSHPDLPTLECCDR